MDAGRGTGHCRGWGSRLWGPRGLPRAAGQGGGAAGAAPSTQAPPWGWGRAEAQAGPPAHGWVWLGGAHGWAGQHCGDLETGPAAALLGQGLTALGGG